MVESASTLFRAASGIRGDAALHLGPGDTLGGLMPCEEMRPSDQGRREDSFPRTTATKGRMWRGTPDLRNQLAGSIAGAVGVLAILIWTSCSSPTTSSRPATPTSPRATATATSTFTPASPLSPPATAIEVLQRLPKGFAESDANDYTQLYKAGAGGEDARWPSVSPTSLQSAA